MRFAYILLVAAVTLLSSGNAQATAGAEGESRLLRSHKTTADDVEEERRLEKAVVKNLPEQFSNMYHSSTKMDNAFSSWYQGWRSVDDAVQYMKREGVEFDAIAYFVKKYRKYIKANGGQPY
ncbi:hypothetical protein V7S43_005515 [Phytophthora oleae]|uniref:RxLR effector protein n=1 Tax=Phytophthora oleae TaxID=2107226 RepID=A0ABD3FTX3_9STRA